MAREKEGFREILARLNERYPGKEVISLVEAIALTGICRKTLMRDKNFPRRKVGGKWIVPIVPLAHWLS